MSCRGLDAAHRGNVTFMAVQQPLTTNRAVPASRPDVASECRTAAGTVVHPAVVRLAEGTTVLRRIVADRPTLVAKALLGGATPEQVAGAVGLELVELRTAVSRWAARQRQDGQLTPQEYTDLLDFVFGPAG